MRPLALTALILTLACTTAAPPPPPAPAPAQPEQHGFTVEEEARILMLEDRREYDPAFAAAWTQHANPLHRLRIALALGRIGPHVLVGERHAGLTELATLATDSDRRVREMTAFALGEIGDNTAEETLFTLANDADASVASEAVEALSKLKPNLPRYVAIAEGSAPEGVRARAVRYLFRFANDDASAAAMRALASTSAAVRQEGAYALARRPLAAAQSQLELLLTDPNTLTRAYATTSLGRIGAASTAPLVFSLLGDAHPWVRTNAAIALGRIAEKDRSVLKAADLPRIFAALEDPDPGVRASMIDVAGYYAESNETARQRLLDVMKNGTQWERELAAGSIAKHLQDQMLPDNLPPWSRVRVIEATAATPHGALLRKQVITASEPLVRASALGAIPDDKTDAEIDIIRGALTDADVIVRANAIDRYGATKQEPADARLATLKQAEERERSAEMNDARLAAISAIAKIDHPEREAFLRGLLADADPVARRIAAELIVEQLKAPMPQYAPLAVNRTAEEYAEIVRWSRQPHTATIHMTRGVIELALLTQDAPMTTWNFAQLAKRGFFHNTSFMRVVPNFVIQGGDPRNDMNGGPGYAIRDEINLQKYTRGAVGMALSGPDTGGSQFFITHSPQPHLDGGYTIFGRVYDGMSGVVDQTERGDRVERIAIDEHPPVGADVIGGIANVSLPLETGTMTMERLLSRVPDYAQRTSAYQPDATVVEMMKSYVKPDDRIEVYMGTWCSDSQREVPKLLRIVGDLKSQHGVELPTTFYALDRSKQKPAALVAGKDVQKVATFIYYRGDRELGRIVERPQAVFEDDLLALAAKQ
ncbi:MAG TPA: HEAT repeat domain-containing protein [Thermoanaerobaculia bacterium]|nr:HEAT repeat domain-containing protein [Thermoanaerobaculia bacterium]